MSRTRIRQLLSQLNANELAEHHKNAKFPKDMLLTGMPGKAEREMFGKLVMQQREKDTRAKKNANLKRLFEEKLEQKRSENERRMQRDEYRDNIKQTGGYLSASDSDADGALQAILDPFKTQDKGGEKKRGRRNTI